MDQAPSNSDRKQSNVEDLTRSLTLLIFGQPKAGKAVALDTPILSVDGWKTMGDIAVGDVVYSGTGQQTRVIAVSEVMHDRECFKITFSEGSEIVADASHEWVMRDCQSGGGGIRIRVVDTRTLFETFDISVAGRTAQVGGKDYDLKRHRWSVRMDAVVNMPKQDVPEDPWVLGYWIGNGTHSLPTMQVTTGSYKGDHDFDHVVRRFEDAGYAVASSSTVWDARGAGRVNVHGATRRMQELTDGTHIPHEYLYGSADAREQLLRGLMDSDGYAGARGLCEFSTIHRSLAEDVLLLARTLGFKATLAEAPNGATLNGARVSDKFRVVFSATQDRSPFSLPRKHNLLPVRKTTKWGSAADVRSLSAQVVGVDPCPSVPVRCIMVDSEDHMFLVGKSLIPTHNSTLAATAPAPRLFLDIEHGAKFLDIKPVVWNPSTHSPPEPSDSWDTAIVPVRNYDTVLRAHQWLQSGKHPFRSVIIDSVSELQAKVFEQVAGREQIKMQQWGEILRHMAGLMRDLRDLTAHPTNPLTSVVLTCMARNLNGQMIPYLQGQAATIAPYLFDITGYLAIEQFQHPDPSQPPYKARRLYVVATDQFVAGERVGGRLGELVEQPDLNISTMLDKIFGKETPSTPSQPTQPTTNTTNSKESNTK